MSSSTERLAPCTILSRDSQHAFVINFHSLPVIAHKLPAQQVDYNSISIPSHLKCQLADPKFHIPGQIDALLGAELFFDIFYGNNISVSAYASLHSTKLGWVLTSLIKICQKNLLFLCYPLMPLIIHHWLLLKTRNFISCFIMT